MNDQPVFAKCARRLVPLTMLLYAVCTLDRQTVAFAALDMNRDLGFSATVYGIGASIFFVGFVICHVPSSLMLERVGARRWIAILMGAWGLVATACAAIQSPASLYTLRFLLGLAEAGFFPGMILYLSFWFPRNYRARVNAAFVMGIPLARIIGGPLASLILQMNHFAGLAGWRWLFLMEGIPAILLVFAVLKFLPDGPEYADWLSSEEKCAIATRLKMEDTSEYRQYWTALHDPRIYVLGLINFCMLLGADSLNFWLPLMVQATGYTSLATGFVVAVIYLISAAAMFVWGRSSDRSREVLWHVALPALFGAGGFALAASGGSNTIVLIGLTCATVGFIAALGPFYTLPAAFLAGPAAATGIALIYAIGTLAGIVGPAVVGLVRDQTGGYTLSMALLAIAQVIAASGVLALQRTVPICKSVSP